MPPYLPVIAGLLVALIGACSEDRKVLTSCTSTSECSIGDCIASLCLVPDDDLDGDGLTNAQEGALGSDPQRVDTDGDGVDDGVECGVPSACTDSDGDDEPDLLEPSHLDADGDCVADQEDVEDLMPLAQEEKVARFCSDLVGCSGFEQVVEVNCPTPDDVVCDGSQIAVLCSECQSDTDCDDANPCTTDSCALGLCENVTLAPAAGGGDLDGDGTCDAFDDDPDGDTVLAPIDQCPLGETSWTSGPTTDNDGDGCQDSGEDLDDDNDGCRDDQDAVPLTASPDSDGDGVADDCDPCAGDHVNTADTDGDGLCDDIDPDIDNDGCLNPEDAFPAAPSGDADGDGTPDHCDLCFGDQLTGDSDGDGTCDDLDACPDAPLDDCPLVTGASFTDYETLRVTFSQPLQADTAEAVDTWSLGPSKPDGLSITSASLVGTDTVDLTLSAFHMPMAYTLTIDGLASASGQVAPVASVEVTGLQSRVMFLTAEVGTGELSSWANSGGLAGMAAADAVCQAEATAAGLVGTYVAYMSDSTNDAWCHAAGLSDLVADDCGGAGVPMDQEQVYLRTDGHPVSLNYSNLFGAPTDPQGASFVLVPLDRDATGAESTVDNVRHGTEAGGMAHTATCTNWTLASGSAASFDPREETDPLYLATNSNCGGSAALVCMSAEPGGFQTAPDSYLVTGGMHVFVNPGAPGTGGSFLVSDADFYCELGANSRGLPNPTKYRAYLSVPGEHARCRILGLTGNIGSNCGGNIPAVTGPFKRWDGVLIAEDLEELYLRPRTTMKRQVGNGGTGFQWQTGANTQGGMGNNCSNFTDDGSGSATNSHARNTISDWSYNGGTGTCAAGLGLLCFETP